MSSWFFFFKRAIWEYIYSVLPLNSFWIDDGITIRGRRRLVRGGLWWWWLVILARAFHFSRLILGLLLLLLLLLLLIRRCSNFLIIVAILIRRRGRVWWGSRRRDRHRYVVGEHGHELLIIKPIKAVIGVRWWHNVIHGAIIIVIIRVVTIPTFFNNNQRRRWVEEGDGIADGPAVRPSSDGGEVEELVNPMGLIAVDIVVVKGHGGGSIGNIVIVVVVVIVVIRRNKGHSLVRKWRPIVAHIWYFWRQLCHSSNMC